MQKKELLIVINALKNFAKPINIYKPMYKHRNPNKLMQLNVIINQYFRRIKRLNPIFYGTILLLVFFFTLTISWILAILIMIPVK
jgi:hypothetical protein